MPGLPPKTTPRRPTSRARSGIKVRFGLPRRRWMRIAMLVIGIPGAIGLLASVYFWVSYGRMIDARLGGEQRPIPRLFARPFVLETGRALLPAQLVQRLNDIGYAERQKAAQPGEFSLAANQVLIVTRPNSQTKSPSQTVKVDFTTGASPIVRKMTDGGNKAVSQVTFEAPLPKTWRSP